MINSINKKNGLRKVMIIVGMCFVLGLFSGCLDLSDETNENPTGNTTENITENYLVLAVWPTGMHIAEVLMWKKRCRVMQSGDTIEAAVGSR